MPRACVVLAIVLASLGMELNPPARAMAAQPDASSTSSKVDAKLPEYQKSSADVTGTIKSVGSDTMNILVPKWAEGFQKIYPDVRAEIESKGSATAPPALIEGSSSFGPMSREWKSDELDKFVSKYGYKPTVVPVAVDMLAVYVNKDNPIKGLTFQQIDAIFSKKCKGGAPKDIITWGELGLTGEWADKPINLYGRNSVSGTYAYFKDHALFKGDFKDTVKEQAGTSAVVQAVANDKYGIGYGGIGYRTADVLAAPLSVKEEGDFVTAEPDNAYKGKYPLARFLYLSLNERPGAKLDPLRGEFLRFVLSRQGQQLVEAADYLPLPATVAAKSSKLAGINP